ncbi:hypothetical protein M0638_26940 [Roseomonas sp. NAR14]|uniref:Uncharacterized protein n=1 Tax=Roseomonas acroporae TaxID=2937791 RepID=A0A9X1YG00_9PROT|nr:hypothetical protein [Roseomonas acroporae]MCK8787997.1 hypothetical protein [Roseomonas acroporae]
MATLADIDGEITLEISGAAVTPARFRRAVIGFFDILTEVSDAAAAESGEHVEWRIQVKKGSNLIGASPAPGVSPAVVAWVQARVIRGLEQLEREPLDPPAFSERALTGARHLAQSASDKPGEDTTVRVWSRQEVVPVTRQTVEHVASVLEGEYSDHGTVEGQLNTVTSAGGYRVVIYEPVFGKAVRCDVPQDMMPLALKLFGRRVEAHGSIRYRRDGTIARVRVEELVPFPLDNDLPTHEEVRGILRTLT